MIPVSLSAKKTREGHSLQSVALVNEVVQSHQQLQRDDGSSPPLKPVLRKQYSNSSIHSSGSAGGGGNKGPPPPYKQPPPPPVSHVSNVSPNISNSKKSISEHSNSTYANVQMRHPQNSSEFKKTNFFSSNSCYFSPFSFTTYPSKPHRLLTNCYDCSSFFTFKFWV